MSLSPETSLPVGESVLQHLTADALSLLSAVAADEQDGWGGGAMTPAPYDTAWVAMVRDPRDPDRLAFPESLAWLLTHQADDGSWGTAFPHTLLPTMAGLLALRWSPRADELVGEPADRAAAYLHQTLRTWVPGQHESVGFEVVAPYLLAELAALGLDFDFGAKDALLALYREKLLISGPELLYSGQSNLIHSLEAFGTNLDFDRLRSQQAANGSYGCSPAATAATLIFGPIWDEKAAAWLRRLSGQAFGGVPGGMPNAYPIDAFETSWVLYNLLHGGLPLSGIPEPVHRQMREWLHGCLSPSGASISRIIGMPTDSDDTGMVLTALHLLGEDTPNDILMPFQREAHFACFHRERGASMSANAHVLAALLGMPMAEREALANPIAKVTDFLFQIRDPAGFWQDKWHVSPYYATASAVLALAAHNEHDVRDRLRPSADWVLATQLPDGGWGHGGTTTLEETAYALQVLQTVDRHRADVWDGELRRGLACLQDLWATAYPLFGNDLPRLWLGKEVYAPIRVVFSAALGVLMRGAHDGQLAGDHE